MALAELAALRVAQVPLVTPEQQETLATTVAAAQLVMAAVQAIPEPQETQETPATMAQAVTAVTQEELVTPATLVQLETLVIMEQVAREVLVETQVIPVMPVQLVIQETTVQVVLAALAVMLVTPALRVTQETPVITEVEVLEVRAVHKALLVALEILEIQLETQPVTVVLEAQAEHPVPLAFVLPPNLMGVTEGRVVLAATAAVAVFLMVPIMAMELPEVRDLLATEVVVAAAALAA